ncbi:MAG: membrane protein insertion efficiency factor YidD [Candidatus Berkiella sp.]
MAKIKTFIASFLLGGIHLYQRLLSPLLGNCCRFYPSCSLYAVDAIEKHGAGYGCYLTIKRLSKCHPFHEGGIDLVPTSKQD